MNRENRLNVAAVLFIFVLGLCGPVVADSSKKPLSLQDMMKFKEIHDPLISDNGKWVVYNTTPGRGNGEVTVYQVETGKSFLIERGAKPQITPNGAWIAAFVKPDFAEMEKAAASKTKKKKLKNGLALLNSKTGKITAFKRVKAFGFSKDSKWMFYCLYPKEKEKKEKKEVKDKKEKKKEKPEKKDPEDKKPETSTLVLRRLADGKEIKVEKSVHVVFDPRSKFAAYSVFDGKTTGNCGLYIKNLGKDGAEAQKIHSEPLARYSNITWSKIKSRLAFIFHKKAPKSKHIEPLEEAKSKKPEDKVQKKGNIYSSALLIWDGAKAKLRDAVPKKRMPAGWVLPNENKLSWTKDGERLFFGFKPGDEYLLTHPRKKKKQEKPGIYDVDALLEKRGVDVWHWQDPLINSNQKKRWYRFKKRVYTSVYLYKEDRYVRLADRELRDVQRPENPEYTIGFSDTPYLREVTWDGRYADVYYVNLWNGTRKKILTHQPMGYRSPVHLSYNGRFIAYYKDKHWRLYNIRTSATVNLTASIKTPFYNEDHDYPYTVPGYGIAGWTENDRSVLIYDKFDIWEFPTGKGETICLTGRMGRKNKLQFRVKKLDPEAKFFKESQAVLLTAYSDEEKYTGLYRGRIGKAGVNQLIQAPDKTFKFVKKAKKANKILFTRENFQEFPDLWVTGPSFKKPKKISNANPQKKNFLWGTSGLIEWNSFDGRRLQGVVIKPENYDPKKRYPVLVYYYRFSSQRVHRWNQVVINHRPCFPYYAGNGYVVFLPDIRFEVGRPGLAAAKCLVPGVQKLVDLGIADAKAIGLHGHSWSGYQTAFVITQTDIFAAAVAGAPVSNMTSAYSGIRWGSGMARQFQYEKSQSRIGPSLYDAPHLYFENSPVFYAKRINTPLLIQFGDKDEAVPWYQGIELYLAMRRLDKNCIFLQYNGEPHHLKKYPNKLDYTIKMKQFLDHYLLGKPAPAWITKGIPYQKK
jgi:hypothetical protein